MPQTVIVVLGIMAVCALLPVVAAYFERRMVWPYSDLEPLHDWQGVDPYCLGQLTEAQKLQFRFLGRATDLKGARYKISYYLAASPGGDTIAIVGAGSIFGIPLKGTWLHSIGPNDTGFCSVNNDQCAEFDLSGRWKGQVVFGASFGRLYQAHRSWLEKLDATVTPLRAGQELNDFRNARSNRIEFMARNGWVRQQASDPQYWKYTAWGAIKCGLGGYFVGMFRRLKAGKI